MWCEAVDQSSYVGAVFFDQKKAFDRVWHRGLLAKLERAGVCGSALKWFSSYLLQRHQVVAVDGILPGYADLHAGVPQGAILSPLLFSLYMNDIPQPTASSTSEVNLFAVDTSLYVTATSASALSKRMQQAIDNVSA